MACFVSSSQCDVSVTYVRCGFYGTVWLMRYVMFITFFMEHGLPVVCM